MKIMGKRSSTVILSLIAFLFCFGSTARADDMKKPDVAMEVSSVYGQEAKIGSHIPLTVSIYDQSEAAFSGHVVIRTLENGSDDNSEIYEYRYPVSANTAETKKITVYVPLGQRSNQICVSLRDEKGNSVSEKTMDFDVSRDMGRLLIGTLSDEPEKLSYLNGVSLNYGMVRSKTIPFDADTLPADFRGLELLDILVINHFESDALSQEQKDAVMKWTEQGGMLLFGMGDMAFDTVGGFYSRFYGLSILGSSMENVSMGAEYDRNAPGDSGINMVCTSIWVPGGTEQMENDGEPLLTMMTKGKGKVGFFAYDLGDISEFAGQNPTYGAKLLADVIGEDSISRIYYNSTYGNEEAYWNAQSLVNTGNADRLPNLPLYSAAAVIYILAVGPGLYLFLKKKDASYYYGGAVMICSLIAGGMIYLAGARTRFTSEFYTLASILDMNGEQAGETTYLNIRTPDSRPYSVEIPSGYEVTPITKSSRYGNEKKEAPDKKKNAALKMSFGENGTVISAKRSRAFDSRFFRLDRDFGTESSGRISGELKIFGTRVTGSLTNENEFVLTDAVILSYGQILSLGTLEPGKTVFVDEELMTWSPSMTYAMAEWLSGNREKQTDGEYLDSVEKSRLYSWFFSEYYGSFCDDIRLAAFGPENSLWSGFSEYGQSVDGRILYTSILSSSSRQDGLVWRSGFRNRPKVTTGGSYSDGMILYGTDPVTVEYFLGTDIDVEELSFLPVSEEFLEAPEYAYLTQFDGEAYFYNYDTKEYDRMELSGATFPAGELKPYLSSSNSLMVKYMAAETEYSGNSQLLPVLMVTGRER